MLELQVALEIFKPGSFIFYMYGSLVQSGTKSCLRSHYQKDRSLSQSGSEASSLLPPILPLLPLVMVRDEEAP